MNLIIGHVDSIVIIIIIIILFFTLTFININILLPFINHGNKISHLALENGRKGVAWIQTPVQALQNFLCGVTSSSSSPLLYSTLLCAREPHCHRDHLFDSSKYVIPPWSYTCTPSSKAAPFFSSCYLIYRLFIQPGNRIGWPMIMLKSEWMVG